MDIRKSLVHSYGNNFHCSTIHYALLINSLCACVFTLNNTGGKLLYMSTMMMMSKQRPMFCIINLLLPLTFSLLSSLSLALPLRPTHRKSQVLRKGKVICWNHKTLNHQDGNRALRSHEDEAIRKATKCKEIQWRKKGKNRQTHISIPYGSYVCVCALLRRPFLFQHTTCRGLH